MPTREEIVAWLREAAEHGDRMGYKHLSAYFQKRATQVENMRCETCKYWKEDLKWNKDKVRECTWMGEKMTPPAYGCFNHCSEA